MPKRSFCPTPEEMAALERASRVGGPDVRWRARGLWLHATGRSYRQVAQELGISKTTLARWIDWFRDGGLGGLKGRSRRGRTPVLRQRVQEAVERVVHRRPKGFGIERSHWTIGALREVIARDGVEASEETVRLAVHGIGLNWKRAKKTITSPDPEYEKKRGSSRASSRSPHPPTR